MGINASLTVVPKSEIRKPDAERFVKTFDLWREWNEIKGALEIIGGAVAQALEGKNLLPELDEEDLDFQITRVSPALAKKIDATLKQITDEEYLSAVRERRKPSWRLRKQEHKGVLNSFSILKAAYRLAAKYNAYVEIFIG